MVFWLIYLFFALHSFSKVKGFSKPRTFPDDETHPDWHDKPCLVYQDNELLVEGLPQAQLITKTVVFENTLPENVQALTDTLNLSKEVDILVQRYEVIHRQICTL